MIHLDNGGNNELYRRWFDNYFANNGLDFEYIGLSYYPFWHGTLDMLRDNMNDIASRYGKKLIVAEVSMGFTLDDYKDYEKLPDELRKGMATKKELAEKVPFPMTPEGQRDFMKAFLDVIHGIRDNMCEGYFTGNLHGCLYPEVSGLPQQRANICMRRVREVMNGPIRLCSIMTAMHSVRWI